VKKAKILYHITRLLNVNGVDECECDKAIVRAAQNA